MNSEERINAIVGGCSTVRAVLEIFPPSPEFEEFLRNRIYLDTMRDFATSVSLYLEEDEKDNGGMNVFKSSTWAVCQEFLGNLSDEEDLLTYAQSRSGQWSSITMREFLTALQVRFP